MKSVIALALSILFVPVVGSAQSTQPPAVQDRAQGYLYFGMNAASYALYHAGGGADFRVFKGLGINTEVEATGRLAYGEGLFSIGPSYHFLEPANRNLSLLLTADTRARSLDRLVRRTSSILVAASITGFSKERPCALISATTLITPGEPGSRSALRQFASASC
jgi:hypothetical protein